MPLWKQICIQIAIENNTSFLVLLTINIQKNLKNFCYHRHTFFLYFCILHFSVGYWSRDLSDFVVKKHLTLILGTLMPSTLLVNIIHALSIVTSDNQRHKLQVTMTKETTKYLERVKLKGSLIYKCISELVDLEYCYPLHTID